MKRCNEFLGVGLSKLSIKVYITTHLRGTGSVIE